MRISFKLLVPVFIVLILAFIWYLRSSRGSGNSAKPPVVKTNVITGSGRTATPNSDTEVSAHNLMLRKGPSFRIYVRWLHGRMQSTHRNVNPSFDDPQSFNIDIDTGILRANIGDIQNYLNTGGLGHAPLAKVHLWGDGNQINLNGTVHKLIPLPIQMSATLAALPDGRVQLHVTKIDVLKLPFKALLSRLHITVSDFFKSKEIPGVEVTGDDIFFDTSQLLPPPRIRGHLTAVHIVNPDLEEIYGNAQGEAARVEQWRNFLHLKGGSIDFGRLTMHPVDLILIDISSDPWFDLDLAHYQKQLVYGYTRMTPQAGLQIFMPDLSNIPQNQATENISIQWMKNRDLPPPKDVTRH
jgi:hypothetical protein